MRDLVNDCLFGIDFKMKNTLQTREKYSDVYSEKVFKNYGSVSIGLLN